MPWRLMLALVTMDHTSVVLAHMYYTRRCVLVIQAQQAHRMSCGPFSLNYGGEAEAAGPHQGPGVRSRTRRSALALAFALARKPRHILG